MEIKLSTMWILDLVQVTNLNFYAYKQKGIANIWLMMLDAETKEKDFAVQCKTISKSESENQPHCPFSLATTRHFLIAFFCMAQVSLCRLAIDKKATVAFLSVVFLCKKCNPQKYILFSSKTG